MMNIVIDSNTTFPRKNFTTDDNHDKTQLLAHFKHLLTVFPSHLSLVLLIADIDLVSEELVACNFTSRLF